MTTSSVTARRQVTKEVIAPPDARSGREPLSTGFGRERSSAGFEREPLSTGFERELLSYSPFSIGTSQKVNAARPLAP
jgi:hypothetical protein